MTIDKYTGRETPSIIVAEFSRLPPIYSTPDKGELVVPENNASETAVCMPYPQGQPKFVPRSGAPSLCIGSSVSCSIKDSAYVKVAMSCKAISSGVCLTSTTCANDNDISLSEAAINQLFQVSPPGRVQKSGAKR